METRNRLTGTRVKGGRGEGEKTGEGASQGTGTKDPWIWTTGWGLTAGGSRGRRRSMGEQQGKTGTTVIKEQ